MCVDTCECRGLSHLVYQGLIVFVTFTCIIEYIYVYRYGFIINSIHTLRCCRISEAYASSQDPEGFHV